MTLHDVHNQLKTRLAEWQSANQPAPLPEGHRHVQRTVVVVRHPRDRSVYSFRARTWCWCGAEHLVTARVTLDASGVLHVARAQTQAHKPTRRLACVLPSASASGV